MIKTLVLIVLSILAAYFLTACGEMDQQTISKDAQHDIHNSPAEYRTPPIAVEKSYVYRTFEEALLASTDVIIAQYVGHKDFGETLIVYEFVVHERVLGNAADRFFVYLENIYATTTRRELASSNVNMLFENSTSYLLALEKLWGADLKTHEDGYIFINNLVVNLDNPSESNMYNEPLSKHSTKLDFNNSNLSREQIISFVSELTANNTLSREHIRSGNIEDIISGSHYVLVVEINEALRLLNEQASRDWMETDIYYCTIIQTLKGDIEVGHKMSMVFFADTVKTGQQFIIAAERLSEGGNMYTMSSKNSVYDMNQLEEIKRIIIGSISENEKR